MAIENLANEIQKTLKGKTEIDVIHSKVSKKLYELGSKTFVTEYNKAIQTKNFSTFI